jgi:hypothetical protein
MRRSAASCVYDEGGLDLAHTRTGGHFGDPASGVVRQFCDPGRLENSRGRTGGCGKHIEIETTPIGDQDFGRRWSRVGRFPSTFDCQAMPMRRMFQKMCDSKELQLMVYAGTEADSDMVPGERGRFA